MDFHISSLLPELTPADIRPKIRNERAYVISLFVDRLNQERGKLKPLAPSFVAFKLSHLNISDLYFFLKKCEQGDSFSKIWWGSLKTVDKYLTFKRR